MNELIINKETKNSEFTYTTEKFRFTGNCTVNADKTVENVNAQVYLLSNEISIGNCSSNGSTSVNIYNNEYKSMIDTVAQDFKALQGELTTKYLTSTFNELL